MPGLNSLPEGETAQVPDEGNRDRLMFALRREPGIGVPHRSFTCRLPGLARMVATDPSAPPGAEWSWCTPSRKQTAARMSSWRCWGTSCGTRSPRSVTLFKSSASKARADPELEELTDVIDRQVQQLTRLVDDLFDVARISQGKINLQMESLDLRTVVIQAVEVSRPRIDARKHDLRVSLPEQAVEVEGDLFRLVQVVANLLNNSAKYSEEGGRIDLEC